MKRFLFIVTSIVTFSVSFLGIWILYYHVSLAPTSNKDIPVNFSVKEGSNYYSVTDDLVKNKLIKSGFSYKIYIKLHKPTNIKAGVYLLNKNMGVKKIVEALSKDIKKDLNSVTVTFKEGRDMRYVIGELAKNTDNTEDDVKNVLKDKEYLQTLIDKYWFIDDSILNDDLYYPLEGYLSPNTYTFRKNLSVKDIFKIMLDEMDKSLSKYKKDIKNSKYTPHEILTLASIVELEGNKNSDRRGIAGVFYNRLNNNWSLGSDVTAYYGAGVALSERDLTTNELNDNNPYNTRISSMAGKLPIGPICNPSVESIEAVLNPTETDNYYFVADKNGETYFTKTEKEHIKKRNELIEAGLWYTYE